MIEALLAGGANPDRTSLEPQPLRVILGCRGTLRQRRSGSGGKGFKAHVSPHGAIAENRVSSGRLL